MVASDRGQLLLLGGLAMAIVFLAAIPLSNSLVVTESAATSETAREIDRTADQAATVERAVRTLANRTDAVNNTDAFNESLRNYSLYRTHVSGQQSGVYVNATVNTSASPRAVNNTDFREPVTNDNQEWQLVSGSQRVTEFNITVEDASGQPSGNSAFIVNITNASGDEWELRVADPAPPGGVDVDVRAPGESWADACSDPAPFTINVRAGRCTNGGTFPSNYNETVTGPYNIGFTRGDRITGYYNLTTSGDLSGDLGGSLTVPYVDITYNGPDTSYTRTIAIDGEPQSASASASTSPSPSLPDGTVFTGTSNGIRNISGNNSGFSTITTSPTPTGLGPASDIDSDGTIEVPYVDGSGNLRLVTGNGDEEQLANNGDISGSIQTTETRLAVGTWNGSDRAVFFANENEDTLYRIAPGGSVSEVATPDAGVGAVVGPADIDGDGTDELVFEDDSATVRYIDPNPDDTADAETTGVTVGQNNGIGTGSVLDYDNDGAEEVVISGTGSQIGFVDSSGSTYFQDSDLASGQLSSTKSPPTAGDVDGDGEPELVYVSSGSDPPVPSNTLRYLDEIDNLDGSGDVISRNLTDASDSYIDGDDETGVT